MNKFLTQAQIVSLIAAVGQESTVIVKGEAGIGKTAMQEALQKLLGDEYIYSYADCAQMSVGHVSVPIPNRELGTTQNMYNEIFGVNNQNNGRIDGSRPVCICLDEFMKAPQPVKVALSPILYDRRAGVHGLPKRSIVWATSNLTEEGLGDSMQSHTKNRLTIVHMRKPTKDEWVNNFAYHNDITEEMIAFCELHPQVFHSFMDYRPGGAFEAQGKELHKVNPYIFNPAAEQDAFVSPRSLARADLKIRANKAGKIDDDTLHIGIAGDVGSAAAAQIMSVIRFGRDIPTFERVVAAPAKAPLPTNPTAQVVQVFQFVTQVSNRAEAEAVCVYVKRMRDEMQSLFCNTVANAPSKTPTFAQVPAFVKLLQDNRVFFQNAA